MAALTTTPNETLSKPNPPLGPPPPTAEGQSPVIARLVVDDLREEVGFVSDDIWRCDWVHKKEPKPGQDISNELFVAGPATVAADGDEDEEPPPPTARVVVMPRAHARGICSERWTVLPGAFLPRSSQFPGLPPAAILLPKTIALPPSLGAAWEKGTKPFGVLLTDAVPVGLETVFVNAQVLVGAPVEGDQDLEGRVKEALGVAEIVRTGDYLLLGVPAWEDLKGKGQD